VDQVGVGMSAIISECGLFRYRLERDIQPALHVVAYFGINPSTADADLDDATVRKWRGFSQRNDFARFIVGNVFAFRATNVARLASADDPIGPGNMAALCGIIRDADVLVPCWGSRAKLPPSLHMQLGRVQSLILSSGKPVRIFGLTKTGDPMHPLMLGYNTPLIEWVSA